MYLAHYFDNGGGKSKGLDSPEFVVVISATYRY